MQNERPLQFSHHTYKWTKPFTYVRHEWSVVGAGASVSFHVSIVPPHDDSAGLEIHYFAPPSYMEHRAPSHLNCPFTGGRCWHDGTSLYATETLWPRIKPLLSEGDHETIFRILEHELAGRMEVRDAEIAA